MLGSGTWQLAGYPFISYEEGSEQESLFRSGSRLFSRFSECETRENSQLLDL